jgi:hypothetical protein
METSIWHRMTKKSVWKPSQASAIFFRRSHEYYGIFFCGPSNLVWAFSLDNPYKKIFRLGLYQWNRWRAWGPSPIHPKKKERYRKNVKLCSNLQHELVRKNARNFFRLTAFLH